MKTKITLTVELDYDVSPAEVCEIEFALIAQLEDYKIVNSDIVFEPIKEEN